MIFNAPESGSANPSSVPRLQANEEQMQREVLALRRGHLN